MNATVGSDLAGQGLRRFVLSVRVAGLRYNFALPSVSEACSRYVYAQPPLQRGEFELRAPPLCVVGSCRSFSRSVMGGGVSKSGGEGEKKPRFSLKRSRKQAQGGEREAEAEQTAAAEQSAEAEALKQGETVEVTQEVEKSDAQAQAEPKAPEMENVPEAEPTGQEEARADSEIVQVVGKVSDFGDNE